MHGAFQGDDVFIVCRVKLFEVVMKDSQGIWSLIQQGLVHSNTTDML